MYKINLSVFTVPVEIVDKYLKTIDETALKVILYLCRYGDTEKSLEEISENLAVTEEDVQAALVFWERLGLIGEQKSTEPKGNGRQKLSPKQISSKLENTPDLLAICDLAEDYFGTKLNPSNLNTIIWLYEDLGYNYEMFGILFEFCADRNKLKFQYIQTVAVDWHERALLTVEQLEEEIAHFKMLNSFNYMLQKMFFLKQPLTTTQKVFSEKWKSYNYDPELINFAYERTVERTGNCNFKYIDKILENWRENGIDTLEKAHEFDKNYKGKGIANKQSKENTRSYDLSDVLELFE